MTRFLAAAVISLTILGHYSSVDAGPCCSKPRQHPPEGDCSPCSPLTDREFSSFSNVRHLLQRTADLLERNENRAGVPLTEVSNTAIAYRLEYQLSRKYRADHRENLVINVLVWDSEQGQFGLTLTDDVAACNVPEPADECLESDGFLQNELQFAGSTRHYAIFWLWSHSFPRQQGVALRQLVFSCTAGDMAASSLSSSRGFAQGVADCVVDTRNNRRFLDDGPRVVLVLPFEHLGRRFEGRIFVSDPHGNSWIPPVTVVVLPAA